MTPTVPKERPILFKGEMVRAILEGRKTQTRRAVHPRYEEAILASYIHNGHVALKMMDYDIVSPYGEEGDRLWVKETFAYGLGPIGKNFDYRADCELPPVGGQKWKPSIFMPRKASRITLEITEVRVERLQAISGADAIAEGITIPRCGCEVCAHSSEMCPADQSAAIMAYAELWESINGKNSWAVNPFVWCVSFTRLTPT